MLCCYSVVYLHLLAAKGCHSPPYTTRETKNQQNIKVYKAPETIAVHGNQCLERQIQTESRWLVGKSKRIGGGKEMNTKNDTKKEEQQEEKEDGWRRGGK